MAGDRSNSVFSFGSNKNVVTGSEGNHRVAGGNNNCSDSEGISGEAGDIEINQSLAGENINNKNTNDRSNNESGRSGREKSLVETAKELLQEGLH